MKTSVVLLLSTAFLAPTNAHYLFGRLILNNTWSDTWEYVRQISPAESTTSPSDPDLLVYPNTNPDSPDLRCGRNATLGWSKPKVAVVEAGDKVGFGVGQPRVSIYDVPRMYHPGFGSAWLSKVEGDGGWDGYAGDGDWFKILQITGRTEQSVDWSIEENKKIMDPSKVVWGTYQTESWNFTIPSTTPSGKYLLRFEHIFPNAYNAQFYVNCAHVEIVNDAPQVGTPGPSVKIPGVYTRGQPDVYFSSYDYGIPNSLDGFVPPAPEVWSG